MNKMKKSLLIFLAVALIVTIIGCGNDKSTDAAKVSTSNSASSTQSTQPGQTESNEDPVKIVFLTQGDQAASAFVPGDRILSEINKRLNIDLEIKLVPQGGAEKIAVALATGDLPDIVSTSLPNAALNQWIDEGLLVPLDDYLDDLPTVKESCLFSLGLK
jgi:putative aldouronate transport system substrate-binding protein